MRRFILRLPPLLFLLAFIPTASVLADMGPKPSMEFEVEYETKETPIESGVLYECSQSDCSDALPLEEIAVQGFRCYGDSCSAVAYGFKKYHRIELTFEDGRMLKSNIFETTGFLSNYTLTVRENDLLVRERFAFVDFLRNLFWSVCCFGAGLAVLPVALAFQNRKRE